MTNLNEELLDDLESDEEVPYEDDEDDVEEEELEESPQTRQQPNQVAQLRAKVADQEAEIADLKKRLGNATEKLGKRLQDKDREIEEWLEKINPWHEAEVQTAYRDGFEEGQRTVETRLLSRLGVEDKAAYLEEVRKAQPQASPRTVVQLDTRRQPSSSDANEDINELVQEFIEQGVPLDQLEQTSAKAVVASGTKWLRTHLAQNESEEEEAPRVRETRQREESGAARVSSGGGATARPTRSSDTKRLEQINAQLRTIRGKGNRVDEATQLLKEKKQLEARLARRAV